MKWRLGLDIGSSSIGWAVLELNRNNLPYKINDSGSRIFSNGRDPKGKRSLAEKRREPRGHRRNKDRYKKRRQEFMAKLINHGLMPKDKAARKALENYKKGESRTIEKDPWILRVKALEEKITLYEFGRTLFHLQQRRGFKSNRKTDKVSNENGAINQAAQKTRELIEELGAKTIGQALASQRLRDPKFAHLHPVRARSHHEGAKLVYDIYPLREMIEHEFNALWKAQAEFHGQGILTNEMHEDLLDTLLFQRPLKAQAVGKCTLLPNEQRSPSCLPSQQLLRIYQEVNNLRIIVPGLDARSLTIEERNQLVAKLKVTSDPKFSTLRNVISLPTNAYFNLESEKRKKLKGDATASILKSEKYWGKDWISLPARKQDAIVEILNGCEPFLPNKNENPLFVSLSQEIATVFNVSGEISAALLSSTSEVEIANWLAREFNLLDMRALSIANAPSHPKWPQGHGRLGRTASQQLLSWLSSDQETAHTPDTGEIYQAPYIYSEAVRLAGYESHSALDEKQNLNRLPYYGKILDRQVAFGTGDPQDNIEKRLGKIANPTVHVALNQLRKVMNDLIKQYGKPAEIIVETARDLPLSAEGLSELEKEQKNNQNINEKIADKLTNDGFVNNYENRLKYRLWEELNPKDVLGRCCPFSGQQIGMEKLFTPEIEIEHILPYAKTGDDSRGNKTLATRKANRDKGNNSPYLAFGHSPGSYIWEDIVARASNLPNNKKWRFNPDAMERFDNESAFQDRHLNDTRYINRITKTYLEALGADVWVTPGKLTSDLRHQWGLNSILAGHNQEEPQKGDSKKNRNDHRHHAIDAIVVALTDRGLLQKVAMQAARGWDENKGAINIINGLEHPWPSFRDEVRSVIENLIVSHKLDHGLEGQLHNDTSYGLIAENIDGKGMSSVVHRVPLASFSKPEKLASIRDEEIKSHLIAETEGLSGKEFTTALIQAGEAMSPPVRKVRIVENIKVIPIINKETEKPYKAFKGDNNYCYEIFADSKGKWTGNIVQRFHANQQGYDLKSKFSQTGEPLIMRLHNHDMIAMLDREINQEIFYKIVKMSQGKITVAKHFEANVDSRDRDDQDDYTYWTMAPSALQAQKARKVRINAIGIIFNM